jgi:hypothetical protein
MPDADEAATLKAKKEKEELDKEIAKVLAEVEERRKIREERRAERKRKKGKEKDKDKDKEEAKKDDDEEKTDKTEKDAKIKELEKKVEAVGEEESRIFTLNKHVPSLSGWQPSNTPRSFYQQRMDRIRNAEQAKRNRERLRNPNLFPTVPNGNLQ